MKNLIALTVLCIGVFVLTGILLRVPRTSDISTRSNVSKSVPSSPNLAPQEQGVGAAALQSLAGRATIIDGDTIEVSGTRIRLFGLDAPEGGQTCRDMYGKPWLCGSRSALALADFIGSRQVECMPKDRDRYNRVVAICRVDGDDMGAWIVRQGLALDWPKYSKGLYATEQLEASEAKRGLWSGRFVAPWDWRRCVRAGGRYNECSE